MYKLTNANGSVLFIQRPKELEAFLTNEPRVLPFEPQAPGMNRQAARLMGALLVIVLLLAASVFATIWIVGKTDQPGDVQPATTMPPPHQPISDLPWQQ
jgi:hypothetical protein